MKMTCPHCGEEFDTVPETVLRAHRIKKGLSVRQAGEMVGISVREMTRYERGVGNPRLSVMRRLAAIYETTIDELWPETEDELPTRLPPEGSENVTEGEEDADNGLAEVGSGESD